ncbi:uncharacterized protein LOC129586931 [Paramacrobiotus metropolitanus]|uniref:uncharacterized protein LOC129586931 n=1 Tax=Paramacrobiotus metropolitanus TaxID=2943436 RepID=UPI002445A9CD|nr:uncharacterized protein LOC129586931 [Paramacrobiotus metropolitanus]
MSNNENLLRYNIRKEFEAAKSREAQLSLIRHLVTDVKEQLATSATSTSQPSIHSAPRVYYGPASSATLLCNTIRPASRRQFGNVKFLPLSRPSKAFNALPRPNTRTSFTGNFSEYGDNKIDFTKAYLPGKRIGATSDDIVSKSRNQSSSSVDFKRLKNITRNEFRRVDQFEKEIKPAGSRGSTAEQRAAKDTLTTDNETCRRCLQREERNISAVVPRKTGSLQRAFEASKERTTKNVQSERLTTASASGSAVEYEYVPGSVGDKTACHFKSTLNQQLKAELIGQTPTTSGRVNRESAQLNASTIGKDRPTEPLTATAKIKVPINSASLNEKEKYSKSSAAEPSSKQIQEIIPSAHTTRPNKRQDMVPQKHIINRNIKYFTDQGLTPLLCAFRNLNWKDYANKGRWNMFWGNVNTARALYQPGQRHYFTDDQLVNHFPSCYQLSRKDNMTKNIKKYRNDLYHANDPLGKKDRHGNFVYLDLIAPTYLLPFDFNSFVTEFRKHGGLWIVKPCNGCQGQGIYLVNQLEQAKRWQERAIAEVANSVQDNEAYQGFLISRYIANPLLIDGKKFDLRLYVLVTSFKPLRCYYYRQGFCRFCAKRYSPDSATIDDKFMHLTNVAIQKQKSDYNHSHGNKWNVKTFRLYLERVFGRGRTDALFDRIFWMIVQSLKAALPLMDSERHCYEMYGYDCLIDAHLKPWLLEINASPSLEESTPIDRINKTNLLMDTMRMAMYERCPGLIGIKEKRPDGSDMPLGDYEILYLEPPSPRPHLEKRKADAVIAGQRDSSIQGRPRWNI